MNRCFSTLLILSVFFTAFNAGATAAEGVQTATLTTYRADIRSDAVTAISGNLTLNFAEKQLTLSARTADDSQVIDTELPIVKVSRSLCGDTMVTAMADRMPVDGLLEEIVITDHSSSTCKMAYSHGTEFTYRKAYLGRGGRYDGTSYFGASKLQPALQ